MTSGDLSNRGSQGPIARLHDAGEDDGYAGAVGFLSEKVGDTKVMFAGKPGSQRWQQNVITTRTTR